MTLTFLPGEPTRAPKCSSFVNWNLIQVLAYCSGNNLVILTKNSQHLQTIYLDHDAFVMDINKVNGKIAIVMDKQILIYTPTVSNFYNFNFNGRKNIEELKIHWHLETTITNKRDNSQINCICWSDSCDMREDELDSNQFFGLPDEYNSETSCELAVGSNDSLTLFRFYYKSVDGEKIIHKKTLWFKPQPNPIFLVKFSPNSTAIASVGYYDKLVKIWHRVTFGIESSEFQLSYLPHPTYVTSLRWKSLPKIADTASNTATATPRSPFTPKSQFDSNYLKPANSNIKITNSFVMSSEAGSITSIAANTKEHNVLYTLSADSVLRVFTTFSIEGYQVYNAGSLDLYDGNIKDKDSVTKFASILDNHLVSFALNKLISKIDEKLENEVGPEEMERGASVSGLISFSALLERKRDYLAALQDSKPEIVFVFDSNHNLNLYGLTNLSLPAPTPLISFRLNEIMSENGTSTRPVDIKCGENCIPKDTRALSIQDFAVTYYSSDVDLSFVIHDMFKNSIKDIGFSFEEMFNFVKEDVDHEIPRDMSLKNTPFAKPIKQVSIGTLQQKFTGHFKSITRLIRSTDGSSVLSLTRFNENHLWEAITLHHGRQTLTKRSTLFTPSPVMSAVIWKQGDFVVTLVEKQLVCFDCRFKSQTHDDFTKKAPIMTALDIDITEENSPLSFLLLPESSLNRFHIVAIFKDSKCQAWEVSFSDDFDSCAIDLFEVENLPPHSDNFNLHIASAIDPVGWGESIDKVGRDVLSVIDEEGFVRIYYTSIVGNKIKWYLKNSFLTGIKKCAFLTGSSASKLAIVNKELDELTIWDSSFGTKEYEETLSSEDKIKDIDWTCTSLHQSILAVGFKLRSVLYTQLRFDYTNNSPTFSKIKQIDIHSQTTHEIGDSIWMRDGLLVIGSGNQFYLSDKGLDPSEDPVTRKAIGSLEISSNDLFHLTSALNGPLPLYHPQFLIQAMFTGRLDMVEKILVVFSKALRELDAGVRSGIDTGLDFDVTELIQSKNLNEVNKGKASLFENNHLINGEEEVKFTKQMADIINEKLQKFKLPFVTGHQQITLATTVSMAADIFGKYKDILDLNGLRFFMGVKLFQVNLTKENRLKYSKTVTMRDISFAMHSDYKDLIFNYINEISNFKITWLNAKRYGLAYWLDNLKLTEVMEKVARNDFFKYQEENDGAKDPSVCSIYYLALKKKQILLGLWRTSSGHPEQSKMIKFLNNDFKEKRWRSAAMKNAFVLLGKHRYIDAAYFFLLAESLKDSVNVIINKLKDVPLAIAVARCYEGNDHGPILKSLLQNTILPDAITSNDRWVISWCFWLLGDKIKSIQSLIKPIEEVVKDVKELTPDLKLTSHQINSFNNEDPVLLIMYNSLRMRQLEYFKGASKLDPRYEFQFIAKSASMYESMGCDLIALNLVRNWVFLDVSDTSDKKGNKVDSSGHHMIERVGSGSSMNEGPASILDSFMLPAASSNPFDPTTTARMTNKYANNKIAPPAAAYSEPDMSAFDFGF